MKTMKYIITSWVVLSLSLLCFSCMDDEIVKNNNDGWCDGKTLVLSLETPANGIVNPMTRSSQADTTVQKVDILIYKDGALDRAIYCDENNIASLQSGRTVTLSITDLGNGATGMVYAVANYSGKAESKFPTEEALKNATFGLDGANKPQLLLFADGMKFDVANAGLNKVTLGLKRIYSMITVKVDMSGLANKVKITPMEVKLMHVPNLGRLGNRSESREGAEDLSGNFILHKEEMAVNGDIIEAGREDNFLGESHEGLAALYMYENRQPDGTNTKGGDQTKKTPQGYEPGEIASIIETDYKCSYIQLTARYDNLEASAGIGSGMIVYRFFLGRDATNNFDVERNVHYQLTLSLKGNGGIDESSWRVDTNLLGDITITDVYLGYRAGSTTKMYVFGDMTALGSETPQLKINTLPSGNQEPTFAATLIDKDYVDANGRKGYVYEIKTDGTNYHDYEQVIGEAVFTLKDNITTRTAKVYQVPRLVDPIAFYKAGNNEEATDVIVKKYDEDKRAYVTLVSKGPWVATIDQAMGAGGSDENWYEIYTVDKDGNEVAQSKGESIHGEGEVRFVYKPKSKLTAGEDQRDEAKTNGARFGKIVVKYHNESCAHDIYLRQGYNPTTLGSDDFAWSMFNCKGKTNDMEAGKVGQYPTETGWLFNGGCDFAMQPYNPGYRVVPTNKGLTFSNRQTQEFGGSWNVNHWGVKVKTGTGKDSYEQLRNSEWSGLQGPCPDGYVVPTAHVFRDMTHGGKTEVYTGYVHDDDPVKGWKYEADGAVLEQNDHCNPAKGVLFIEKDKSKNIFFNFGKGVMTEHNDPKLIDEIGIGHRYVDGKLTYTNKEETSVHAYGAYYWNGTEFSNTHMGKVDFGYNMFSNEPSLVDVPGYQATEGGVPAVGISAQLNGSFVRCVRDLNPYVKISVSGKFKGVTVMGSTLIYGAVPVYADTEGKEYLGTLTPNGFTGDLSGNTLSLKGGISTVYLYVQSFNNPWRKIEVDDLKKDEERDLDESKYQIE